MLKKVMTASLSGIDADFVMVEADVQMGLPGVYMVGLADTTIKEARERIRSAISNSGFQFPKRKITINLSPANLPKEGSHFDLPIAVGILGTEDGTIMTDGYGLIGELSLDGTLKGVRGALPLAMRLREAGVKRIALPNENAAEAALLRDVDIYPFENLAECIGFLKGDVKKDKYIIEEKRSDTVENIPDFADVQGQEAVKRALIVAAAGRHGVLMMGSPGSGKTMMAKRLPYIMPDMTYDEMLEVVRIHSAAGHLTGACEDDRSELNFQRPFRSPHHTITKAALIGGGRIPRPGELSMAHNGILFLDEFGEFDPAIIELLRQPVEEGFVTIDRVKGAVCLPSDVMLVAAANPCRCGYFGDDRHICTCTEAQLSRYFSKFSGPMLDRIDMHIQVTSVMQIDDMIPGGDHNELQNYDTVHESGIPLTEDVDSSSEPCRYVTFSENNMSCQKYGMSTADMKAAVENAAAVQQLRYKGTGIRSNSNLTESEIKKYCILTPEAEAFIKQVFKRYSFSMRTYYKLLKVARTIADLDTEKLISATGDMPGGQIQMKHIAEAVQYRSLERFSRIPGGDTDADKKSIYK